MSTKNEKFNVAHIELIKNGMELQMKIKVAAEVEAYFKNNASGENEVSRKWLSADGEGLSFYSKNKVLSRIVENMQVMDNFGNGLIDADDGRINVAFLRAVGVGSEAGITVKCNDLLSYEEMKQYVEGFAAWTRKFYEEELRPAGINATVTFEA